MNFEKVVCCLGCKELLVELSGNKEGFTKEHVGGRLRGKSAEGNRKEENVELRNKMADLTIKNIITDRGYTIKDGVSTIADVFNTITYECSTITDGGRTITDGGSDSMPLMLPGEINISQLQGKIEFNTFFF